MSKAIKRERQKDNKERARIERERLLKRDRQMKAVRGLLILLAPIAVIAIIITATGGKDEPTRSYAKAPKMTIDANKSYTATIETDQGNIVATLDPKVAPNVVNSFVFLARNNFYDDLCFDRQSEDFLIQGGSPKCDRIGGAGYTVTDTPGTDAHPVGSLVAATTLLNPTPGLFSSQFFIVTGTKAPVGAENVRFGTVTSGLEIAQKIEKLPVDQSTGEPKKPVKITRITIKVGPAPAGSSTTSSTVAPSSTSAP